MSGPRFYIGIDWGSERHAICVTRADGSIVKERFVENDATALEVIASLSAGAATSDVVIGIESRRLALVEALIARGYKVATINPKQVDRFRERFSPAGAKDDRFDARVTASALRTDRSCFQDVQVESTEQLRLRAVMRLHDATTESFRAAANRFFQCVLAAVPALVSLCQSADEPWFWELVGQVLNSEELNVDDEHIAEILKRYRIRRLSVTDIRLVLARPRMALAAGTREATALQVRFLTAELVFLRGQLKSVEAERSAVLASMKGTKESPSDVDIIASIPGFGRTTTAVVCVEAGQAIAERNVQQLRALSGVAPVSRGTGVRQRRQKMLVVMRRANSNRLRNALHHAAAVAAREDPRFQTIYREQRSRGATHGRACRAVGDRLLAVLVAMLRSNTTYVPGHRANRAAAVCPG